MSEPIAIVGMAALHPRVRPDPSDPWRTPTWPAPGPGALDDVEVDLAGFGIPPAHAASMTRMQVLLLEAARRCLLDAGHPGRALPVDTTDVVVALCGGLDRQYTNALRIESARYARSLQAVLSRQGPPERAAAAAEQLRTGATRQLRASAHDRVGEMASTIPARIAAAFALRGRTLAVESADVSSFVALSGAMTALRGGTSDAVLVLAGQGRDSPLLLDALAAEGLPDSDGVGWAPDSVVAEGAGAVLLKRRSAAVRDGDRVYALLRCCVLDHDPKPGTFRRSVAPDRRRELRAAADRAADVAPDSVQVVVDSAGRGPRAAPTFAHSGLAAVLEVALGLDRREVQGCWSGGDGVARWRPNRGGGPRRAAVEGTSRTGTLCRLVLDEYVPGSGPPGTGPPPAPAPIAVVAMAGRFAGAPDAAAFWTTGVTGRDAIRPLPERLLDRDLHYAAGAMSPTRSYTDLGAAVPVPDRPPAGVPITPLRYGAMDPAQRLALDVAAELLGPPGRTGHPRGSGTVVVGSTLCLSADRTAGAYRRLGEVEALLADLPALGPLDDDARTALRKLVREEHGEPEPAPAGVTFDGVLASGIAAVIANEYRLRAVPMAVEAACASTLAAIDLAAGALRSGAVDHAIAGGVEIACTARDLVLCSALALLSPTRITPFDVAADGFTPGDGCALFLLKRLDDAVRDGDDVLGVLTGIGASNDARSLIAPDAGGQELALRRAYAGLPYGPETVDHVEAHGTGTKVGDRVEVAAISAVYGPGRRHPLSIGSAKGCFGHTFAAAGGAGLLRVLAALRHRTLPPTANLTTVSPDLDLAAIPAEIGTGPRPWPAVPGRPRRAAVSSFGTGGINYHLLVEEYRPG